MANTHQHKNIITELIFLFLKLGTIAFGGPAAHISMIEEEVVHRRKWITREHFLDLVGATNLIPGPNSTEMVIHIGYIRGGLTGLVVSGLSFITPAVIITGILAWVYVSFGSVPQVAPFLFGIKPAVIAVILAAIIRLGKTAAKNLQLIFLGIAVCSASLLGANEVLALLSGGILGIILSRINKSERKKVSGWIIPLIGQLWSICKSTDANAAIAVSTAGVGSIFPGLVKDYGWLTQQQLIDAIAIGQFTPGPVLSTATFVGYVVSGVSGAVISTVAIFLPSFIFVLILNPVIPRLRASKIMSSFLDAVNISAIGLMAAVVIQLANSALTDWKAVLIVVIASVAGIRFKLNAAWIVMGGALGGWLLKTL